MPHLPAANLQQLFFTFIFLKRIILAILLLVQIGAVAQKIPFSITIRFELITSPRYIYVFMNDELRTDTIPYPESNVLTYSGTLSKPGTFQLATDSAVATQLLWIDNIPASVTFKEKKTRFEKNELVITNINGSEDAIWLYNLGQPRQMPAKTYSPQAIEKRKDSSNVEVATFYYNFIDSLIKKRPASLVIPYYIQYYRYLLGNENTQILYNRLNAEQQNYDIAKEIIKFLNQNVSLPRGALIENFTMKQPNGKQLSLYDVSGNYILLDFWASWCGPCRVANTSLVKLYEKFNKKGLQVISISLDDDKNKWIEAIKKDKLPWLHVSELRRWESPLVKKYQISAVPFTILLDGNYKVVSKDVDTSELDSLLSNLLK